MRLVAARELLADLFDSYRGGWGDWEDGSPINPASLVSGAVNQDATLDDKGDVWLEGTQSWATRAQLENIVRVLQDAGNIPAEAVS